MRVRISYSVDLESVPKECARMLEESIEHLQEVHRDDLHQGTTPELSRRPKWGQNEVSFFVVLLSKVNCFKNLKNMWSEISTNWSKTIEKLPINRKAASMFN